MSGQFRSLFQALIPARLNVVRAGFAYFLIKQKVGRVLLKQRVGPKAFKYETNKKLAAESWFDRAALKNNI